jgi:hypothetical protein
MGWFYQLIIGMLSCILIYYVGIKILENQYFPQSSKVDFKMKYKIEQISFTAAVLFNFNQGLVYTLSMYSELTFTFFQLLGLYILFYNKKKV